MTWNQGSGRPVEEILKLKGSGVHLEGVQWVGHASEKPGDLAGILHRQLGKVNPQERVAYFLHRENANPHFGVLNDRLRQALRELVNQGHASVEEIPLTPAPGGRYEEYQTALLVRRLK